MRLNLVFLLFITVNPFLTELISKYGNLQSSDVVYYLAQTIGGISLSLLWNHASNNSHLTDKNLSKDLVKFVSFRVDVPPFVFLGAAAVSLIIPRFSYVAIFAMFPIFRILSRKYKLNDDSFG